MKEVDHASEEARTDAKVEFDEDCGSCRDHNHCCDYDGLVVAREKLAPLSFCAIVPAGFVPIT